MLDLFAFAAINRLNTNAHMYITCFYTSGHATNLFSVLNLQRSDRSYSGKQHVTFLRVHNYCSLLFFTLIFFEWWYKVDGSIYSLHSSKPVLANDKLYKRRCVECFFFFPVDPYRSMRVRMLKWDTADVLYISKWYFQMQFKILEKKGEGKIDDPCP